ncbi:MAG TPA: GspMb/PilO family protein [Vicinamibacterales bacterium]|jgi:Tfp pilus assembly protein PilO
MRVALARIFAEKRAWFVPLAVALLANVAVYVLAVYPLSIKVRNAETRERAAAAELAAARNDHASAQAAQTARDRATAALSSFYTQVLPRDLTGARSVTYLRVAQLAQKLGLRAQHRTYVPEKPERESSLGKLKTEMTFAGDYEEIRQFIYELETAPEFVVIEDMSLAEGGEPGAPLVLTLSLSTYYQVLSDGT